MKILLFFGVSLLLLNGLPARADRAEEVLESLRKSGLREVNFKEPTRVGNTVKDFDQVFSGKGAKNSEVLIFVNATFYTGSSAAILFTGEQGRQFIDPQTLEPFSATLKQGHRLFYVYDETEKFQIIKRKKRKLIQLASQTSSRFVTLMYSRTGQIFLEVTIKGAENWDQAKAIFSGLFTHYDESE